jgi:hypothetical protein
VLSLLDDAEIDAPRNLTPAHVAGLAAGTVICVNSLGGASLAQITGVPCSALLVPMVVIGGIVTHAERRLVPGRGR